MNDQELILYHGGPSQLAKKLGYPKKGGAQVVHNWMRRGIPAKVKVDHPEMFLLVVAQPPPAQKKKGDHPRRRSTDQP